MTRKKYWVIGVPVALVVLTIAAVAVALALLVFGSLPLIGGVRIADGAVTVVADGWGPVAIGAYVFELGDGKVGLVDATIDPEAESVMEALTALGKTRRDVRAIFFTHGHDDHTAGALAFPDAGLYTLEPRIPALEAAGRRMNVLSDGDLVELSGTTVEVFHVPGHTKGSAAYLVHGVLFLGDSAAAARGGTIAANPLFSEDSDQNEASLRSLAERLGARPGDVRYVAFGHQGPVEGLDPLLDWARGL